MFVGKDATAPTLADGGFDQRDGIVTPFPSRGQIAQGNPRRLRRERALERLAVVDESLPPLGGQPVGTGRK